jgi:hypothetical protein
MLPQTQLMVPIVVVPKITRRFSSTDKSPRTFLMANGRHGQWCLLVVCFTPIIWYLE